MQAIGIEHFIKDHLCFGETGVSKGQTLRMLIDRNHLSSPVYVGDTQGDADACHAAGIPFILPNTDSEMFLMQNDHSQIFRSA